MREYLSCHPTGIEYDFSDYDDVSDCVYDYIKWWIFDLLHEGEVSKAKEVLNTAFN